MAKKMTAAGAWLAKRDAERAKANAEGKAFDAGVTLAERAQLEKLAGRKLTDKEIFIGRLLRTDDRAPQLKLAQQNFRVVYPKPQGDDYLAEQLAEAEQALRDEAARKLSPAQKQLQLIQQARADKAAREQREAEYAKRMADPRMIDALSELARLETEMSFDARYNYGDLVAIEQARAQLTTPGSDLEVGYSMAATALGIESLANEQTMTALQAKRAQLQAEIDLLAEFTAETPELTPDAKPDGRGALVAARTAAYNAVQQLPKEASWSDRAKAHEVWKAANDAVSAHDAQAASAGAEG